MQLRFFRGIAIFSAASVTMADSMILATSLKLTAIYRGYPILISGRNAKLAAAIFWRQMIGWWLAKPKLAAAKLVEPDRHERDDCLDRSVAASCWPFDVRPALATCPARGVTCLHLKAKARLSRDVALGWILRRPRSSSLTRNSCIGRSPLQTQTHVGDQATKIEGAGWYRGLSHPSISRRPVGRSREMCAL